MLRTLSKRVCHIQERNTPKYYQLVSWGREITDELGGGAFYHSMYFSNFLPRLFISLVSKKKKEKSLQLRSNKLTFYSDHPRVRLTPFLVSRCPCPGDPAVPPSG